MKIEKKIVSDKSSLSYKAKAGIATLLGMSAVFKRQEKLWQIKP